MTQTKYKNCTPVFQTDFPPIDNSSCPRWNSLAEKGDLALWRLYYTIVNLLTFPQKLKMEKSYE